MSAHRASISPSTAPALSRTELFTGLGVSGPERFLLVTLHPTTARPDTDAANVAALLGALAEVKDRSIIFTGVNADPGYRAIDDAIKAFVAARPDRAYHFTSLGSERYWAALRLADAVVGNSSSGILEAPAVGVPSINIGDRQQGRLRAASIIDCPADPGRDSRKPARIFEGRFQPDLWRRAALWPRRRVGEDRWNPSKDRPHWRFPEAFP